MREGVLQPVRQLECIHITQPELQMYRQQLYLREDRFLYGNVLC